MTDPLGTIIALLRPQAVLSKIVTGAGAYSIRKPAFKHPAFCLMLEGTCFLDVDRVGSFELTAGDFILLPQMPGFTLSSDRNLDPLPSAFAFERETRHGAPSGPPTMRSLGGNFRIDPANAQLLVKLLPPAIHIRGAERGADRVRRLVELITEETLEEHAGQGAILERLVEVLLMEALRVRPAFVDAQREGLLAGLADPGLSRALRAIHTDLTRRWTVADLARVAHMSRAVFADRFTETVGMPPMEYVFQCRMAIARDALRREKPPLAALAASVGYRSASAFSTAFTRVTGRSPTAFARQEAP